MPKLFAFFHIGVVFLYGCAPFSPLRTIDRSVVEERYESDFEAAGGGPALSRALNSVERIYCSAEYTTYHFSKRQTLQRHQLSATTLNRAISRSRMTRSVYGTGTLVDSHASGVLIVTCNHIADFSDTLLTFRRDPDGRSTPFIESVSIKIRQTLSAPALSEDTELQILGRDRDKDILLLVGRFAVPRVLTVSVFPFGFGAARDLEWGSKTVLLGFPRSVKSITRGMVSNPMLQSDGKFTIDALFNMGYSGAPVLAVRQDGRGFEWVGMALSAAGESLPILIPEQGFGLAGSEEYSGMMWTHRLDRIFYGLCYAVSAEEIIRLLQLHRDLLRQNGFDLAIDGMSADSTAVPEKEPIP
ncbi:trypsin-like peptidase domain-containing protein [candidate division KSB1 bacterium]|nr:trypsin-like peptidase domain-containing protein [candidate division KSB1 bacterium]